MTGMTPDFRYVGQASGPDTTSRPQTVSYTVGVPPNITQPDENPAMPRYNEAVYPRNYQPWARWHFYVRPVLWFTIWDVGYFTILMRVRPFSSFSSDSPLVFYIFIKRSVYCTGFGPISWKPIFRVLSATILYNFCFEILGTRILAPYIELYEPTWIYIRVTEILYSM